MNEPVSVDGMKHVHALLSDYLNDELPEAQRETVKAHLDTCARCRRDFESLRFTVQLVQQTPLQPVPRSFAIAAPPSRRPRSLSWLRLSTSTLAALFVAVLALQLALPSISRPAESPASTDGAKSGVHTMSAAAAPTAAPDLAPRSAASSAGIAAPTVTPAQPNAMKSAAPNRAAAPAAASQPRPAPPAAAAAPTQTVEQSDTAQRSPEAAAASRAAPATVVPDATAVKPSHETKAPPQPFAHQESTPRQLPASGLPVWYTPLLVAVGALLAISLVSLILVSLRR